MTLDGQTKGVHYLQMTALQCGSFLLIMTLAILAPRSWAEDNRFMVLESHRINLRLDYGRSNDSDAVYLSVGEAF